MWNFNRRYWREITFHGDAWYRPAVGLIHPRFFMSSTRFLHVFVSSCWVGREQPVILLNVVELVAILPIKRSF